MCSEEPSESRQVVLRHACMRDCGLKSSVRVSGRESHNESQSSVLMHPLVSGGRLDMHELAPVSDSSILFCRRHLRVRVVCQSVRQRHSGRVIIVSCDALLVSGGRLGMPELVSVSDTSILLCRRHLWGEALCTEPNTGLLTRARLHRWLSGCRCLCHSSGSRVS